MGWQGKDPSTDFRYNTDFPRHLCYSYFLQLSSLTYSASGRGGGFISLENLLYFARNFQVYLYTIYKRLRKRMS